MVIGGVTGDAAERSGRIRFTWTPGQIELPVRVNDAPAVFLLDSASEYSVISSRLAKLLSLPTDRVRGRDFAEDVTLSMGGLSLEHQRVMVMPFDTYKASGRKIEGLLGYDVFSRFVIRIDYDAHAIDWWPPTGFKPPRAAVQVPIQFVGKLPVVASTLTLPGGKTLPAHLVVDTAASQSVILRYPFANDSGLFELAGDLDAKTSRAPSLASGELRLVEVPIETVSLSRWTFDRPVVQAHREPTGSGASTASDGLIGNGLLARFTLTVDFPHQRLWLEPKRRTQ